MATTYVPTLSIAKLKFLAQSKALQATRKVNSVPCSATSIKKKSLPNKIC